MSKQVNLTLTDEQYQLWKETAEEFEVSLSDFIERAVAVYINFIS